MLVNDFDFFVSYARRDNAEGWISRFIEALQEEHRTFTGGRSFKVFFDQDDIGSLDAWQLRIYDSLAGSRLFLAFLSPAYFASEWCRREWRTWIDVEIAKHVLTDGAAPIYIVEVPWLARTMTEQQVAESIASLTRTVVADLQPGLAADALRVTGEMAQRQLTMVQPFYSQGLDALRREDLRIVLTRLAKDLEDRAQHVADAAKSETTIPPFNRRFVGRLDELVTLRERLFQGRTGVVSGHREGTLAGMASVNGLGGIGKTELALTYAHAFAGLYPGGRFLIQCERLTDIRRALLQLDSVFPGAATDEQRKSLDLHFGAIREALRRRLAEQGRVLLVFDNVSDLGLLAPEQTDLIRTVGPQLHVLATTRLGAPAGQDAHDDIHWLTLGELTFEDSLRLLEKHRRFVDSERGAASNIARRLGGFALCVEVVGAYLGQHPEESYAGFLERMGLEDLEQVDAAAERRETVTRRHNNEKRLGAILALTLGWLKPIERTALDFASLLAPDHVALPWLRTLTAAGASDAEGVPADTDDAWRTIERRLVSLALLMRGDERAGDVRVARCHRLVQDYVRHGMTAADRKRDALDELVRARCDALQRTTHRTRPEWDLTPLAALAEMWAEQGQHLAGRLAHVVGKRWYDLARWSEAEPLLRSALAIEESRGGTDRHAVADALNDLGVLLLATGRVDEAEPLLRNAVTMTEATVGAGHPDVAGALGNLAALFKETNRMKEAEELFRRALAILEASVGPEHRRVGLALNNLSQMLTDARRYEEAEPLLRRALAIQEARLGHDHPEVMILFSNLAMLLAERGRAEEAEPLFRHALAIAEASLEPTHPEVAVHLNNLARVLKAQGRFAEAEPLYVRSLAVAETCFGADHPKVAIRLNNLAQMYKETHRLADAVPLMRRAALIFLKFTAAAGQPHPHLSDTIRSYGILCLETRVPKKEIFPRLLALCAEAGLSQDEAGLILGRAFR